MQMATVLPTRMANSRDLCLASGTGSTLPRDEERHLDQRPRKKAEGDIGNEGGMISRVQSIVPGGNGERDPDHEMERPEQPDETREFVRASASDGGCNAYAPEHGRRHLQPVIGERMVWDRPRSDHLELINCDSPGREGEVQSDPPPDGAEN
jgi:hypothetical protein